MDVPVYVVEIDGRAVAAIEAPAQEEAERHAQSFGFGMSLRIVERAGNPLWDGRSKILLRPPSAQEEAKWNAIVSRRNKEAIVANESVSAMIPFGDD